MLIRGAVLAVVLALSLVAPHAIKGQHADKGRIPLVGVLLSEDRSRHLPEFTRALADLGWIDGKTVRLEVRAAEGRHDQMPRLAIELVRRQVNVIAALLGTPPALAAKQATATIPIVFTTAGDPVAFGIVSNVSRPERNLTGVGGTVSLNYKRLQLLKEAVPDAKRVGFLTNVENPIHRVLIDAAERAARQLGLELYEMRVHESLDSVGAAFSTLRRQRVDAIVVQGDAFFTREAGRVTRLVADARVPAIYTNRRFTDNGGLMSISPENAALNRAAAVYVDKILRGAKPSDLPVEEATKFEFVINLKTATALGLTIPPALLLRADHVIQ